MFFIMIVMTVQVIESFSCWITCIKILLVFEIECIIKEGLEWYFCILKLGLHPVKLAIIVVAVTATVLFVIIFGCSITFGGGGLCIANISS